jgi:ribosomal protein S18 acetylase RimI-like enzyme
MVEVIRPARPDDLPGVARLCADHAAYEKADPPPSDLVERLGALFVADPRATCYVVESPAGLLVGYATCIVEFDPIMATSFLHMDCLYLDEPYRGRGLGRRLIEQLVRHAADLGIETVRWQTPPWNVDAIGFYERLGATGTASVQYSVAD